MIVFFPCFGDGSSTEFVFHPSFRDGFSFVIYFILVLVMGPRLRSILS